MLHEAHLATLLNPRVAQSESCLWHSRFKDIHAWLSVSDKLTTIAGTLPSNSVKEGPTNF